MLRLRGNSPATVDDKGRLKLPASFKSSLETYAREAMEGRLSFYLTSYDGKHARLYPMPVWEEIESNLMKVPSTDPARRRFLEVTSYFGSEVELDAQGRFVIPPILREAAQLAGGEVAILGQLNHLLLWNRMNFERKMAVEPLTDEDLSALAGMGI